MKIVSFHPSHISPAQSLWEETYTQARKSTPVLPKQEEYPLAVEHVKSNMGAAALDENGALAGYLIGIKIDRFHGSFDTGVWSPLGLNAVSPTAQDRTRIALELYTAASERWVKAGAKKHAITPFSTDTEVIHAYFHLGFGNRCADFIRCTRPHAPQSNSFALREYGADEFGKIYPLCDGLIKHLGGAPCFLTLPSLSEDFFHTLNSEPGTRIFAGEQNGKAVAYLKISDEGETYVSRQKHIANITGAYCLPEFRGTGLMDSLLKSAENALYNDGYTHLGVDCESLNPAAFCYWSKHFTQYTAGLNRQLDDWQR